MDENTAKNLVTQTSKEVSLEVQGTSPLQEILLVSRGKQLARELADILDLLQRFNREAIGPIISIVEPYMETDQNFSRWHMPPKSSEIITVDVTHQGKAKPRI
jgi:hypothetical protein